jgi:hypothetical protein
VSGLVWVCQQLLTQHCDGYCSRFSVTSNGGCQHTAILPCLGSGDVCEPQLTKDGGQTVPMWVPPLQCPISPGGQWGWIRVGAEHCVITPFRDQEKRTGHRWEESCGRVSWTTASDAGSYCALLVEKSSMF